LRWRSSISSNYNKCKRNFCCGVVNLTLSLFSGEKLHPSDLAHYSEKDGLYPIQALIQPVSLRFKYHFEGARQTNRVDKVSICIRKSTAVDLGLAARVVFHTCSECYTRTSLVHGKCHPTDSFPHKIPGCIGSRGFSLSLRHKTTLTQTLPSANSPFSFSHSFLAS